MVLSRMLGMTAFAGVVLAYDKCAVDKSSRRDCGHVGTTQSQCESSGCCWEPAESAPWCFKSSTGPAPSSECKLAYNSTGNPFSAAEEEKVRNYFLANIDIQNSGAVVAAPDHNTGPGGDYYFHWERDGALSMHALLATSDLKDVDEKFQHYVQWVLKVQQQSDPHDIDIRTEPKYTIPDGKPFMGAWCRPQTDGPGLRGKTLAQYGLKLLDLNNKDYVEKNLFNAKGGAVRFDLDWVAQNWRSTGCDLWEEIQSDDFFWGRYTMRAGLHWGAELAEKLGDSQTAARYRAAKKEIEQTVGAHYDGNFVFESTSRKKDAAVIEAFNVGDLSDNFYPPLNQAVLGTVITLNEVFCNAFEINKKDSAAGIPGILYGRYENDNYDGGNPWVLLSASLATLVYRQAADALKSAGPIDSNVYTKLQQAYGIGEDLSGEDLAKALMGVGDGILLRIKKHVEGTDFHMQEQISRSDGTQTSAKDLTWNYANMLKAFMYRRNVDNALKADKVSTLVI
eukprot:TRINITY_DN11304_c0_g3_i1.p1 TRINITY_DN11304_c0_g3~~TRINITY_DN11304_c0_g3_i1.p1  ORF type:complete len:530 (-),score=95.91 TRINITY_DN11304_c0_g3_i1:57-1580(-)